MNILISVGIAFLLLLVLLWLLAFGFGLLRGRRYVGPDGEELPEGVLPPGESQSRKTVVASLLMMIIAVISGVYWFLEPARQSAAAARQERTSIERGIANYATYCYTCHGIDGKGAVIPIATPVAVAPALNRPDLQSTDPDQYKANYDLVYKTITRGGPTYMPAWGDNGSLLPEQVHELTLMVLKGNWEEIQAAVEAHIAQGGATPIPVPGAEVAESATPDQKGRALFVSKGCVACHTVQGVPGATGKVGPELTGVASRPTIAGGVLETTPDNLKRWLKNPPGVKPGTAMPNLGLSDEEVDNLVAFLLTLK